MRSLLLTSVALVLVVAGGCNRDTRQPAATSPASPSATGSVATTAPAPVSWPLAGASAPAAAVAPFAGHWSGDATLIVQWVTQRKLPVVLDVGPDGRVSGTIGNATLVDARFVPNRLGRKHRIHGKLEGNLIDAEQVRRDAVDILVDRADDGTLVGGLHSSGTEIGGKRSMKLSASDMVLRPGEPSRAGDAK